MSGESGTRMPAITRSTSLALAMDPPFTAGSGGEGTRSDRHPLSSRLGDLPLALLDELEQVAVDDIGMRRDQTVRQSGVVDFRRAPDQLSRLLRRVLDRHDLIVLAVHDQGRDIDLLEVIGEVRLREGLDAVVRVLQAGLHAPE